MIFIFKGMGFAANFYLAVLKTEQTMNIDDKSSVLLFYFGQRGLGLFGEMYVLADDSF